MGDVVKKSSRSLSHLLMSSCTCRLTSRSIAPRVVSDINRSFDELVNELSFIGKAITVLSSVLIVLATAVLIIDSHVGDVTGTHLVG